MTVSKQYVKKRVSKDEHEVMPVSTTKYNLDAITRIKAEIELQNKYMIDEIESLLQLGCPMSMVSKASGMSEYYIKQYFTCETVIVYKRNA